MSKSKSFLFEQKIKCFIDKHKLLTPGSPVLVGVSGGPDSICLLVILYRLGYQVVAGHVNYGLRGTSSYLDEAIVRDLCTRCSIPFYTTKFDTASLLGESKIGLQELARDIRYSWYEQRCIALNLETVATGHHMDDQAETVLFNLMRGTGFNGSQGILVSNTLPLKKNAGRIRVVRPLLAVSKAEIQSYLDDQLLPYAIDESNLKTDYTRNKIRHQVLPLLESIQPGSAVHLQEFAMRMQAIQPLYQQWADELKKVHEMKRFGGLNLSMSQDMNALEVYSLISPYGFNADQIEQIYKAILHQHKGKSFYGDTFTLITNEQSVDIFPTINDSKINITIDHVPHFFDHLGHTFNFEIKEYPNQIIDQNICLDLSKITFPLLIRNWKPGDRMAPLGMSGQTKKIKAILTDKKISGVAKKQAIVLCSGHEVLWCWPGNQISENAKTYEHTQKVLSLKISENA